MTDKTKHEDMKRLPPSSFVLVAGSNTQDTQDRIALCWSTTALDAHMDHFLLSQNSVYHHQVIPCFPRIQITIRSFPSFVKIVPCPFHPLAVGCPRANKRGREFYGGVL